MDKQKFDFFELLRDMTGAEQVSDLKYEPYRTRAILLLRYIPTEEYSVQEISDMTHYLLDAQRTFQSKDEARAFFCDLAKKRWRCGGGREESK